MRNRYFNNDNYRYTQRVVEDLVTEAIQIHGVDAYYLPKTFVNKDNLFGEDASRKFTTAASIELYVKDSGGFGGAGDILSKFGIDIQDDITFTMSRRRFDQIRTEKLLLSSGNNLKLASSPKDQPYFRSANNSSMKLSPSANSYSIISTRPMEGDLLYFPMANSIFEIKFIEHEQPFYQFGALYTYDVQCNRFEYSSENIDTGITEIDRVEEDNSVALDNHEIVLVSGDRISMQNGRGFIVQAGYRISQVDTIANNEFFVAESTSGLLDWSEDNPFSEND